jgi:phage terminase large subunit
MALIAIKIEREYLYCHEMLYETGIGMTELVRRLRALGITTADTIIADPGGGGSSDIYELVNGIEIDGQRINFNVLPASKGAGSVLSGIQGVQESKVYVTEPSINLWDEYSEYHWMLDANKEPTDKPHGTKDHLLDALRYVSHMKRLGII